MAPLLMSCSFQPAVAAAPPTEVSRGPRRSTALVTTTTVPMGVHSSSTAAVVVVIVRNRSCDTTAAATVQHCGRSSSTAPAPSVALTASCRNGPPVKGLANSIAQGQVQRDVEMDCYGGPVSKVSGPPETTASLARGGPPFPARHQRRLQPPSGTLSPPTDVISVSALRSGSNRTRWSCRCSPCRRGSDSSHQTPLHQLGRRPRRHL